MTRPDSRSAQNMSPPAKVGFLGRMALALTDGTLFGYGRTDATVVVAHNAFVP